MLDVLIHLTLYFNCFKICNLFFNLYNICIMRTDHCMSETFDCDGSGAACSFFSALSLLVESRKAPVV